MDYFSNKGMYTEKTNLIDISLFQSGYQNKKQTRQPAIEQAEQKAKVSTSESSEKSVKQEKLIISKASTKQAEEEIIPFTQNSSVASTKLSCELETIQNDFLPIIPIVMYLKEKCLKNPTFATLVCKKEKTLSKCLQYTQQKVCEALKNKNGWLEDKQVYHYAETYYMTPNAILDWNGTSAVTEKSTKNTENKAKKTNVAQNKEPKVQKNPRNQNNNNYLFKI